MALNFVIRAVQENLHVDVDGKPGPETWKAIYSKVVGQDVPEPKLLNDRIDARSEKTIQKLAPEVAPYARVLVKQAASLDLDVKIISGFRSYEEQDALFQIGRTTELNRGHVTNARGGESNHNFGIAFDIGIFDGKDYLNDSPGYQAVGAIGVQLGLEWGGRWKSFTDRPHYQLRPSWASVMSEHEMLEELRRRTAAHQPIYGA